MNDIIDNMHLLDDYMFTNSFVIKYLKKNTYEKDKMNNDVKINNVLLKSNHNKYEKKSLNEHNIITQKDKLFWCFYIFLNGYNEYKFINNNHFKVEKDLKILSIEKLDTIKDKLKLMKIKICDVENELVNKQTISIIGLQVLCLLNKINIVYVKNNTFYEIIGDYNTIDNNSFNVILNNDNKFIISDIDTNNMIVDVKYYREHYWKIENIQKPLKAISAYTLTELREICKKLGIDVMKNNKNLIKKDLYQHILNKI